jgi:hypothetical protein
VDLLGAPSAKSSVNWSIPVIGRVPYVISAIGHSVASDIGSPPPL